MSRPTTIRHPLATLRKAVDLGRQQLAQRLGISRPALEKIERGRNPFGAALRDKVFIATGVCPGWLASEEGPIHTADGYPMTPAELARWEAWRQLTPASDADEPLPQAMGGRARGPLYREDCCVGPGRLLSYAPLEVPRTQVAAVQRFQEVTALQERRQVCNHLIDRARGIAQWAFANWDRAEKPLWEVMAAMDRHFPGVPAILGPQEEAEAKALFESLAQQASTNLAGPPTPRTASPQQNSSKLQ